MDRPASALAFPAVAALPFAADGGRLTVEERGAGVARVMARKGKDAALRDVVRIRLGLELPSGPRFAASGDLTFAGVGPGAWLAVSGDAAPGFAGQLARDLADVASVADQSGAYAVLRLSGPAATDVLAAGAFLDFHPDAFPAGGAAVTSMALIDAVILRRGDAAFDVMVFRSFAQDFWRFLEEMAAAWGAPLARA